MKLLANCQPSGQRILTLHPPEAVLFTHSAAVCGSPEKASAWYLFALSAAAVFLSLSLLLSTTTKKKTTTEEKKKNDQFT